MRPLALPPQVNDDDNSQNAIRLAQEFIDRQQENDRDVRDSGDSMDSRSLSSNGSSDYDHVFNDVEYYRNRKRPDAAYRDNDSDLSASSSVKSEQSILFSDENDDLFLSNDVTVLEEKSTKPELIKNTVYDKDDVLEIVPEETRIVPEETRKRKLSINKDNENLHNNNKKTVKKESVEPFPDDFLDGSFWKDLSKKFDTNKSKDSSNTVISSPSSFLVSSSTIPSTAVQNKEVDLSNLRKGMDGFMENAKKQIVSIKYNLYIYIYCYIVNFIVA